MSSSPPSSGQQDHLSSIRAWDILDKAPQPRLQGMARLAADLLNMPLALVVSGVEGERIRAAKVGFEADITVRNAFYMHALQSPKTMLVVEDASIDARFATDPLVTGACAVRSCAIAPFVDPEDRPLGIMAVFGRQPRSFSQADLVRLGELTASLAASVILHRNVVGLCEAALHDPVTKLGNRTLFECQLDAAIGKAKRDTGMTVMCVNTNRLQSVNTMFGHVGGDHLLREVAWRLTSTLKEAVSFARVGAEEFAILLPAADDVSKAEAAADLIETAMAHPVVINGQSLTMQASVGFALFPEDGESPHLLLERAQATLYEAQRNGEGGSRHFAIAIEQDQTERLQLEHDLRQAIENDGFSLYWQPIVDISSRQPVAYEALLRWDRPGHGMVPPGVFVAAAEECGLSGPLDAWVLKTACREAAAWQDQTLRASVNVSANRIRFGDLSDSVAAALEVSRLAPGRLEIEITERVLVEDEAAVRTALEALRVLGVRIALDDFGTGFSSISYLRTLPLDKLKLDRSFTRDVLTDAEAREVARTVVRLGRVLGLIVLAEGVETEEQLSCLRVLGCDEAQGYLLGWPRPLLPDGGDSAASRSSLLA